MNDLASLLTFTKSTWSHARCGPSWRSIGKACSTRSMYVFACLTCGVLETGCRLFSTTFGSPLNLQQWYNNATGTTLCLKKNILDLTDRNLKKDYPILLISGTNIPDTNGYQITIQIPTLPICLCTTLEKQNKQNKHWNRQETSKNIPVLFVCYFDQIIYKLYFAMTAANNKTHTVKGKEKRERKNSQHTIVNKKRKEKHKTH